MSIAPLHLCPSSLEEVPQKLEMMFLSFTQIIPHCLPWLCKTTRDFPPLEFKGLVVIQASYLPLAVFTFSFFPQGNPEVRSLFWHLLPRPAQRVRKTWNGGERIMKRQTHIIWQVESQRALLTSMAGRQNGFFQPTLLLAEVTWDL